MSTIQFGGVVSGLNTQSIIDALMSVEQQPLTALQTKEANLTAEQTAYGQLGSSLDNVISAIKAFTTTSVGASRLASSSDTSVFTASASPSAAVGQYQISVDRLATATQATSTSALASALTGSVDTSQNLSSLLGTPITAGQMTMTIDGAAVQVAVGDPTTTSLQSLIGSITTALQTQLRTSDATATVNANVVGGHIQLVISGAGAAHTIAFGDPGDTSNAASALGLDSQGVAGATNPTITGTAYLADPTLASLNLPGSISAGQISAVVDGVIVHYTVGDPAHTTLQQLMAGFGSAIQTQLQAGGVNAAADPAAKVSVSVVGNRLQVAVSGAAANHSLSFGAASDTSNALGILGIAGQSVANAANPTIAGTSSVGVVRTTSALDQAGLTGLTSTKTGVLTINGVAINYDTTADSLSTVVSRINNSTAGVIASIDRTNDRLVITRKDTGALAMDIEDTSGTLGAALGLAPGTTNAQQIGKTAQVTVNGQTVVSASNSVSNAIDGVTLNLVSQSPANATETLTIGVDNSSITNAIQAFVSAFNSLGDTLDKLTAQTPGTPGQPGTSGPLASDPTAQTMFLDLRSSLLSAVPGFSGTISSLGDIGISTGAIGAAVGSTTRLQLDTTKLTSALNSDPNAVARLLDDATGALKPVLDQLTTYESPGDTNSYIQSNTSGLQSEIRDLQQQQYDMQDSINAYQAALEAKYATMEATLAMLQSQSSQIAATSGVSMSSSLGSASTPSSSSSSSSGS